MSARKVYACGICGDTAPQVEGWIDLNTNEPTGDDSGGGDFWCPSCEEHIHYGELVQITRRQAGALRRKHEAAQAARPLCPGCGLPEGEGHYSKCPTLPQEASR